MDLLHGAFQGTWEHRSDYGLYCSLGMFWPITTTADFFGQWNNIFMWSAVAIALACARAGSKDNSQKVV